MLAFVLVAVRAARADVTVNVQLTPAGQALARQLGLTTPALEHLIESDVDSQYHAGQLDAFLTSVGDATSFAAHGLGVEYGERPGDVLVGLGGAVSLAANDALAGAPSVTRGVRGDVAGMVGVDLGVVGLPRWAVYADGGYRAVGDGSYTGDVASGGVHAQAELVAPQDTRQALRWTGVLLTGGLEITRWQLSAHAPIDTNLSLGSARAKLSATGELDVASTTFTAPLVVSTGIDVTPIFGLFVGLGADLDLGGSTLDAHLAGHVLGPGGQDEGTVTIAGTADHGATLLVARALAGVELHLTRFSLVAQVDTSPGIASAALGARLAL